MIEVRGLAFGYAAASTLRDISFTLARGEVLCVLGPNGSGKSTLLKCLNRGLRPKSGEIVLDGRHLQTFRPNELARTMGWVPQHEQPGHLRVYEYVLLGRKSYFWPEPGDRDHERTQSALRSLGLEHLAFRHTDELSGGEFQLAQIARAMAQESPIVLFDEPTSSLDIGNQHRLMRTILDLVRGAGRTALISLHDINLALRYADRFLLLHDGKIHAHGGREVIHPDSIRSVYGLESVLIDAGGITQVIPL